MYSQRSTILLAMCLVLLVANVGRSYAHAPDRQDPRFGGVVTLVDDMHVELVMSTDATTVYILSPKRAYLPVPAKSVSATVMRSDGLDRITLRPGKDGGWVSARIFNMGDTTRVMVQMEFADRVRRLMFGPFSETH